MAGSPHFARIKADVLRIMASVPAGQVVSFADIGTHLDVMPRHVAYILATLPDIEKATLPWWRAVAADGSLGTPKRAPDGTTQAALLAAEGVMDPAAALVAVAALPHGVQRQTRPAITPAAPPRRRRSPRSAR
ncbi:MGMT family protein [Paracraurococcus ruber]|uniref:Methylated-DNA-[protein]-cysteine S-methyltransferase DNA binding domain-containing protein n=1 Tax=Paracraurococcus ruber TaxID=77675 RepID=A0ABS1CVQ7_9PROT|nr:MGMT family protein [Paracraurococcus ruber]MBK1658326.1 hypothetical protein [Paracraurococcus ruber]TDG25004.1 hypothetical protein E2C05_25930 [Paracraurococcus ruber]